MHLNLVEIDMEQRHTAGAVYKLAQHAMRHICMSIHNLTAKVDRQWFHSNNRSITSQTIMPMMGGCLPIRLPIRSEEDRSIVERPIGGDCLGSSGRSHRTWTNRNCRDEPAPNALPCFEDTTVVVNITNLRDT